MAENIDNEIFISLVQIRPVLWDKTLQVYKDKNATINAWKEVCCEVRKDFEDMEDRDKNEFVRAVIRRWTNLRDAFSRSKKKQQVCRKSGVVVSNVKKYVYNDQMKFLNKLYDSRETADSLENTHNSEDGLADNEQVCGDVFCEDGVAHHNQVKSPEKNTERFGKRKRRKPDEIEFKMLETLEPEFPNSLMSFFQGVMPHLSKFDDSEVLEFQMGVLQVISKINEKKQKNEPPTFLYHPRHFSTPQPASCPYPQPSCSSHFNPPPTYQTSISQLHLFNSHNNPFPNPSNKKHYSLCKKPSVSQPTQSTAEYYKKIGLSSAATSPDIYSTDSSSPARSESSDK